MMKDNNNNVGVEPCCGLGMLAGYYSGALISRGVLSVLLGALLLGFTMNMVLALTWFFGVLFLVGGFWALGEAIAGLAPRGVRALYGIVLVLLGLLTVWNPLQFDLIFILALGFYLVASGVAQMIQVFDSGLPRSLRLMLMLSALLMVGLGVVFFLQPLAGVVTVTWITGLLLIFNGAFAFALGIRLRMPHSK